MKKLKNENKFMFTWGVCVIVLFLMCSFSFVIRGTRAHFGGTTGTLVIPYKVYYSSNWPDSSIENEIYEHKMSNNYILRGNMFEVPLGYQFVGWNTQADGGGILYIGTVQIKLTEDLYLYAQWMEIPEDDNELDDTNDVSYGDVNQNGLIDEEDYLLIDNYVNNTGTLDNQGLLNADANNDGNVDLVDADIVKQAYLGTIGYVGYLPNSPILIYDIYEGNIDVGTDTSGDEEGDVSDDNLGEDSGENNDSTDNENITAGGGTGTGSGNSGNSQNNNSSSSGGGTTSTSGNISSGSASNDEKNDVVDNKDSDNVHLDDDNNDDNSKKEIYEFKFMNGNVEYASSNCKIMNGSCLLVLPSENPVVEGYRFTGWSLNKGCPEDSGFIKPVYVDSDKIYYACFENNRDNGNNMYLWIIVFGICIISIRLIWYLIVRFRNKNKSVDN